MAKGSIVAGCLAPHPPHLVYADNPEQNEPVSEGGWEQLRWGYERLRESLEDVDYDVIVILSPHWQTYVGTHFIGVEKCSSKSVDPVFPNLFRFNYDLAIDVELAEAIHDQAKSGGMSGKMMTNPDFRVDYGTIVSCHMVRPEWDKRGELLILSRHINASGSLGYKRKYIVDFTPEIQLQQLTAKPVSDLHARALFFNNLGAEALVSEDLEAAFEYFKNALFLKPDLAIAWNNIGAAFNRVGDSELAEYSYHMAFWHENDNATAVNNLAKHYRCLLYTSPSPRDRG